jgi:hypothetical protein
VKCDICSTKAKYHAHNYHRCEEHGVEAITRIQKVIDDIRAKYGRSEDHA